MKEKKYCMNCMEPLAEGTGFCPVCGQAAEYENKFHQLPAGTLLKNRYLIGKTLGEGGFGITYLGRDLMLDLKVAIKEYYPVGIVNRGNTISSNVTVSHDEDQKSFEAGCDRFLSEARILAKFVSQPNVVSVRDIFSENNTSYIVMEYLEGISLQQLLKVRGRIPFTEVFSMLEPVMHSLGRIHAQGMIHRDISPGNLMLLNTGEVKLLDFGAAREYGDSNRSLSVVLKPGYTPEEQYRNHGEQGPQTDIYALCATIYRLITGKIPENAMNRLFEDKLVKPLELQAEITPAQQAVLMKGMAVHAADRYETMEELCRAFHNADRNASDDICHRTPEVKHRASANDLAEEYAAVKRGATPSQMKKNTDKSAGESPFEYNRGEKTWGRPETEGPLKTEQPPETEEPQKTEKSRKADKPGKKEKSSSVKKSGKKGKKGIKIIAGAAAAAAVVMGGILFLAGNTGGNPYREPGSKSSSVSKVVFTENTVKILKKDKETEKLFIYNSQISDELMEKLSEIDHITMISMNGVSGMTTLEPLGNMEQLRSLNYTMPTGAANQVTIDGSEMFAGNYEQIETFSISDITLEENLEFLHNFPNLVEFSMQNILGVQDISPIGDLQKLESLTVNNSDLASADWTAVGSCGALKYFDGENAGLSSIAWMSPLTGLKSVNVNNNHLTSLKGLESSLDLYSLYARENEISDLQALAGHTCLNAVLLNRNQISDLLPLSESKEMRIMNLAENEISDISVLQGWRELYDLNLSDNPLTDLTPLVECEAMKLLYLNRVKSGNLDACIHMIKLESVEAREAELENIDGLTNCTLLKNVQLSDNNLTDLSVLTKSRETLQVLTAANNQLKDITPLQELSRLTAVTLQNNQIQDISPISGCPALKYLTAYGNEIQSISGMENCTALEYLDLGENRIKDITELVKLGSKRIILHLENNEISDISALPSGVRYRRLLLYGNKITDFSPLQKLESDGMGGSLYVDWSEGMDAASIGASGLYRDVNMINAPYDQRVNLEKEIKDAAESGLLAGVAFLTEEEADEQLLAFRTELESLYGVRNED